MKKDYGRATEGKIAEVMDACRRFGRRSIIALSGVPGTGKSYLAAAAAQRLATDILMVREVQFHPSYSYEEFIEGYRANISGGFSIEKGAFLEWNDLALEDGNHTYVLLIEELTRANMPAVLGELMTYVEHRDRQFLLPYSRRPARIAENLVLLATFNPRDRSALEIDEALLRRLRIIKFPPDSGQLGEMLAPAKIPGHVVAQLVAVFDKCSRDHSNDFDALMPFGHGIFADLGAETPDLYYLWHQRILPILTPPARQPHPFYETIASMYPWKASLSFCLPVSDDPGTKSP